MLEPHQVHKEFLRFALFVLHRERYSPRVVRGELAPLVVLNVGLDLSFHVFYTQTLLEAGNMIYFHICLDFHLHK